MNRYSTRQIPHEKDSMRHLTQWPRKRRGWGKTFWTMARAPLLLLCHYSCWKATIYPQQLNYNHYVKLLTNLLNKHGLIRWLRACLPKVIWFIKSKVARVFSEFERFPLATASFVICHPFTDRNVTLISKLGQWWNGTPVCLKIEPREKEKSTIKIYYFSLAIFEGIRRPSKIIFNRPWDFPPRKEFCFSVLLSRVNSINLNFT